ncbi:MAG: hypothetical protein FJZ01_25475 [Candidatus Sericytochromatia bacterium]|nr:hypothetical protein [Candidatus Tanganyikabacteria bacterium]
MNSPEQFAGGNDPQGFRRSRRKASDAGQHLARRRQSASDRAIEPAASRLAIRFLLQDDGAAFERLTRLAVPVLTALAHDATRRAGLAIAPQTLVAELMTAIFLEGNADTAAEVDRTGFLALADAGLHRLVTHHVSRLSRGDLRSTEEREVAAALVDTMAFARLAGDCENGGEASGVVAEPGSADQHDAIGCDDARAVFAAAFHGLALGERRTLLLVDVDHLTPTAVAGQLGVSEAAVAALAEQARESLAVALQNALRELHPVHEEHDRQLGDLLYELVKAALVLDEDVRRRFHYWNDPRDIRTLETELRNNTPPGRASFVRRILDQQAGETCGADGFVLARLGISILQRVEGRSARQRLANGVLLIVERKPAEALRVLEPMLAEALPPAFRVSAARNAMWALGRMGNHQGAYDVGQAFLAEYPEDPLLAFNMAVASSHLGRFDVFHDMAGRVNAICRSGASHAAQVERLIRHEIPRFADELGLTTREVEKAFGLAGSDDPCAVG